MYNIIVVGAGHGGLIAAAKLAKAGNKVTVYEQKKEEDLGYDWQDRFTFDLLKDLCELDSIPDDIWEYRADCAFLSPKQRKKVIIRYNDSNRQKIMWRKPLLQILIKYAKDQGVEFKFETSVMGPCIENGVLTGIALDTENVKADLVIDAGGVFSPIRTNLPESYNIEKSPRKGDLFYGYRAYFNRKEGYDVGDAPFEVYLYHECEKGLSWHSTTKDSVDVLIGRIEPLTEAKIKEQLDLFRIKRPWTGEEILHGGCKGFIPVRRSLTKMVGKGYAAVGDSAFMTLPMNGMGIDLSLQAGDILAKTIIDGGVEVENLWKYNVKFHYDLGGFAAKNEGLKNALLTVPSEGVDFLFEHEIIQSSDLAGAGTKTKFSSLLGKLVRGMKGPKYFFAILNGIIKGGKVSKLYKNAPSEYNEEKIKKWSEKIEKFDIKFD